MSVYKLLQLEVKAGVKAFYKLLQVQFGRTRGKLW